MTSTFFLMKSLIVLETTKELRYSFQIYKDHIYGIPIKWYCLLIHS